MERRAKLSHKEIERRGNDASNTILWSNQSTVVHICQLFFKQIKFMLSVH